MWMVVFAAAGWWLLRLGDVEWLTIEWSDPIAWLASVEVEVALAALARLAGLVLMGWIGLSTVAYVTARLLGADRTTVDWLSIGPVRRTVDALLAGSLLMGSMAPVGAAIDHPFAPEPGATSAPTETLTAVDPAYIPVPAGTRNATADAEEGHHGDEASDPSPDPGSRVSQKTVVVAAGDHLWKLAAEHLAERLGHPATDAEIAPYWVEVVEANRHRLRSGDPDLIFPGEEIVLPPLNSEN